MPRAHETSACHAKPLALLIPAIGMILLPLFGILADVQDLVAVLRILGADAESEWSLARVAGNGAGLMISLAVVVNGLALLKLWPWARGTAMIWAAMWFVFSAVEIYFDGELWKGGRVPVSTVVQAIEEVLMMAWSVVIIICMNLGSVRRALRQRPPPSGSEGLGEPRADADPAR